MENKKANFEFREKIWKKQCGLAGRQYNPPTFVQFDVLEYNDLNAQNKTKMETLININSNMYKKETLLNEIKKYDTSILDELLEKERE